MNRFPRGPRRLVSAALALLVALGCRPPRGAAPSPAGAVAESAPRPRSIWELGCSQAPEPTRIDVVPATPDEADALRREAYAHRFGARADSGVPLSHGDVTARVVDVGWMPVAENLCSTPPCREVVATLELANHRAIPLQFELPVTPRGGIPRNTALYALARTPDGASHYGPVYRAADPLHAVESSELVVPPSASVSVRVSLGWRGTGSRPARPVLPNCAGRYALELTLSLRDHDVETLAPLGPIALEVRE